MQNDGTFFTVDGIAFCDGATFGGTRGIAEFTRTFSGVLKKDGSILAVDGITFFDGTFLAVL